MALSDDIKNLENYILYLTRRSKSHATTDMILGGIRQSTIINFNYKIEDNPLNITTLTLYKIVHRLDELENNPTSYYDELRSLIKNFIKKYILIDDIGQLVKMDLNYITLNKMKDYQLTTPYRLITLKKYAEILEEKRKKGDIHVKH